MSGLAGRRCTSTSNTARADDDIVVPEGVGVSTIRLPTEVDRGDFGLDGAPLPLGGVTVGDPGLTGKTSNSVAVQPSLNGAVGAQVVFETLPTAGGKGGGGSDTLRGEVGKGGIVGLAVVHHDSALATNAEMLFGALGRVGHGDKGDVGVGEGLGGFAGRRWM